MCWVTTLCIDPWVVYWLHSSYLVFQQGIGYLYPLRKTQSELSGVMRKDPTPAAIYKWIKVLRPVPVTVDSKSVIFTLHACVAHTHTHTHTHTHAHTHTHKPIDSATVQCPCFTPFKHRLHHVAHTMVWFVDSLKSCHLLCYHWLHSFDTQPKKFHNASASDGTKHNVAAMT